MAQRVITPMRMKDTGGEIFQRLRSTYRIGTSLNAPHAVLITDIESPEGITTTSESEAGTEIAEIIMACM